MKRSIQIFLFSAILSLGGACYAQHPVGYASVQSTSRTGTFSIGHLDREIVKEKTASFYSPDTVKITFDILISPDGDVKYVRAPRLSHEQHELRLACTSALYGFAFAPVDASIGDQWYKATMTCGE